MKIKHVGDGDHIAKDNSLIVKSPEEYVITEYAFKVTRSVYERISMNAAQICADDVNKRFERERSALIHAFGLQQLHLVPEIYDESAGVVSYDDYNEVRCMVRISAVREAERIAQYHGPFAVLEIDIEMSHTVKYCVYFRNIKSQEPNTRHYIGDWYQTLETAKLFASTFCDEMKRIENDKGAGPTIRTKEEYLECCTSNI